MGNGFDPAKASAASLTDDRGGRGLTKAIKRKVLAASGMTWKGVTPSAGSRKRPIITTVRFTVLHRRLGIYSRGQSGDVAIVPPRSKDGRAHR